MGDAATQYVRLILVLLAAAGVVYVLATGQPNAAGTVGAILAALGGLLAYLQSQQTHQTAQDTNSKVSDLKDTVQSQTLPK